MALVLDANKGGGVLIKNIATIKLEGYRDNYQSVDLKVTSTLTPKLLSGECFNSHSITIPSDENCLLVDAEGKVHAEFAVKVLQNMTARFILIRTGPDGSTNYTKSFSGVSHG